MNFNKTSFFDSPKEHLSRYLWVNVCVSVHLYHWSVSPSVHKWIDVAVFVSAPPRPLVFQKSLTHHYQIPLPCRDDKSIQLSPMPPHGPVRMIYESSWRLNKRPQPAPTERQTQRRGGERDAERELEGRGDGYCRENAEEGNFLMLSMFCNFIETDKWQVCAPITGHKSCSACFQAHTQTNCTGFYFLQTDSVFYRCVWAKIDGLYIINRGGKMKIHRNDLSAGWDVYDKWLWASCKWWRDRRYGHALEGNSCVLSVSNIFAETSSLSHLAKMTST